MTEKIDHGTAPYDCARGYGAVMLATVVAEGRSLAYIGMPVQWRDDDSVHYGEISGIYPHICAVKVKGRAGLTRCFRWMEMIGVLKRSLECP